MAGIPAWAEQKTAIVTGAGSGMGIAIAERLAAEGASVAIWDVNMEGASATAKSIESSGGRAIAQHVDISVRAQVEEAAAEVRDVLGRPTILVNNAGSTWGAPLGEFPENGWDKVMATNVKGIFFLTQALLQQLKASASQEDPARIINIGSIDGIKTPAFDNFSYGASKAAVHHLTRQMAAHLVKEHIIVNAIAPGPFPSWMLSAGVGFGGKVEGQDWDRVGRGNPRGRVGTAEDIAGLAIFLSSRAGAYTVGETITCDGGSVAVS